MGRVTLQTLRAKKFRLLLTSLAVVLGVAFVSGTFVLTDTLGHVFDNLFVSATKGVDAVVRAREPFSVSGPGNADVTRPPTPDLAGGRSSSPSPASAAAQGNLLRYALVEGRNGQSLQKQAPVVRGRLVPGPPVGSTKPSTWTRPSGGPVRRNHRSPTRSRSTISSANRRRLPDR